MSRQPELYHWKQQLASHVHGISPVFVSLLALWSFGMILARRCGLDSVANHLAPLLGQPCNTLRQRLREFYQEAAAKAGAKRGIKRRDLEVSDCFPCLLAWLLSYWSCKRLALALDVTNLGERFHVLCVSVVYGGIGIPVAWKVLAGNHKEAWHPHWCALLRRLQPALGDDWTVVVLSDRGLESSRLFGEIVAVGWHPLMRVKGAGKFRPAGWHNWYCFKDLAPRVGRRFAAGGLAYKSADCQLACTLLACWDEGHAEPWLLLSDLEVAAATPAWYAFRSWIEQSFKMIKSGALQWQHTRMDKPARAERLWLAIAVALLWLVVIGATVESDQRKETIAEVAATVAEQAPEVRRRHRLFVLGQAEWLAAQLQGRPLPMGKLAPQPWSEVWHDVPALTEEDFLAQQTYP